MSVRRALEPNCGSVRVSVVTNHEQLLYAYGIRSICFMEEHGVSAKQIYDGNDYQATHIIVYCEEEPIGAVRLRWFREFAKMERSCILKNYRHPEIIRAGADFVFDHVARKGYDKIITHATPKYAELWQVLLGFELVDKQSVRFINHVEHHLELIKHLEPNSNSIGLHSPAHILFRVEGHWDAPSPFENDQPIYETR